MQQSIRQCSTTTQPTLPLCRPCAAGNLLAPLVATCAADLLVAGYQLLKDGRVSARRLEDLQELKETVELVRPA